MFNLSDTTRSNNYCEESGEAGYSSKIVERQGYNKDLILRANTVPIIQIINMYGVKLDPYTNKTICPFSFHNGGRESTGSFKCYPETNSFHCFGCHTGSRPCDFVMHMDNVSKIKAAIKIIKLFSGDIDENVINNTQDASERLEIMLEFSNSILEFRNNNNTEHSFKFIEYVCWVYDQMNLNYIHDNSALRGLNIRLFDWIQEYNPNLNLIFEEKYVKDTCNL